jgi:hypothetical protein
MKSRERKDRNTIETESREYVPLGPVKLASQAPPKIVERVRVVEKTVPFRVGVPENERRSGYIYDADSGVEVCVASNTLRERVRAGVVWEDVSAGLKRRLVVWP